MRMEEFGPGGEVTCRGAERGRLAVVSVHWFVGNIILFPVFRCLLAGGTLFSTLLPLSLGFLPGPPKSLLPHLSAPPGPRGRSGHDPQNHGSFLDGSWTWAPFCSPGPKGPFLPCRTFCHGLHQLPVRTVLKSSDSTFAFSPSCPHCPFCSGMS